MGFASKPFGTAPWGADPVVAPSARLTSAPITAGRFDGASRAYVQNADGSIAGIHAVDQEVALALSIEEGALASAVTTGHRIRKIKRSAGPTVVADVQDAVRFALRRVLARQDIAIRSIDVDNTTVRGRIVVAVTYVNLRTLPAGTDPRSASAQTAKASF
jgi:hypothetical protein